LFFFQPSLKKSATRGGFFPVLEKECLASLQQRVDHRSLRRLDQTAEEMVLSGCGLIAKRSGCNEEAIHLPAQKYFSACLI
jgi:hypothetical protein